MGKSPRLKGNAPLKTNMTIEKQPFVEDVSHHWLVLGGVCLERFSHPSKISQIQFEEWFSEKTCWLFDLNLLSQTG